ncbi:PREDICTED: mast cell protease 3-like, partial [Elephantulus edwardii]|uniref:mast cell protease 3-like n=1 Tax=Elephantulus edwardii TaxID=28737 RepID=UPI0003F0EA3D
HIIGGHVAKPHSRPYMAFVKYRRNETMKCGGFLLQEDFVLTAAHCLGRSMKVILGAHDFKLQENTQQKISVKEAIPHPKYNNRTFIYDVMLLQGDSGGPLVCQNVAQGIASYRKGNVTIPCFFTKISALLPWIKETIKQLEQEESL